MIITLRPLFSLYFTLPHTATLTQLEADLGMTNSHVAKTLTDLKNNLSKWYDHPTVALPLPSFLHYFLFLPLVLSSTSFNTFVCSVPCHSYSQSRVCVCAYVCIGWARWTKEWRMLSCFSSSRTLRWRHLFLYLQLLQNILYVKSSLKGTFSCINHLKLTFSILSHITFALIFPVESISSIPLFSSLYFLSLTAWLQHSPCKLLSIQSSTLNLWYNWTLISRIHRLNQGPWVRNYRPCSLLTLTVSSDKLRYLKIK